MNAKKYFAHKKVHSLINIPAAQRGPFSRLLDRSAPSETCTFPVGWATPGI
jgi:hypothetical protein